MFFLAVVCCLLFLLFIIVVVFVAVVVLAAVLLAVVALDAVTYFCCSDLRNPIGVAGCTRSVVNPAAPSTQVERHSSVLKFSPNFGKSNFE